MGLVPQASDEGDSTTGDGEGHHHGCGDGGQCREPDSRGTNHYRAGGDTPQERARASGDERATGAHFICASEGAGEFFAGEADSDSLGDAHGVFLCIREVNGVGVSMWGHGAIAGHGKLARFE